MASFTRLFVGCILLLALVVLYCVDLELPGLKIRISPAQESQQLSDEALFRLQQVHEHVLKARQRKPHFPSFPDFSKGHPALLPLEYPPDPAWRNTSFPDLWVVGMAKAGTTHLHQVLETHHDVVGFHERKEYCSYVDGLNTFMTYGWDHEKITDTLTSNKNVTQQHLASYHYRRHRVHLGETRRTINGCLHVPDVALHYYYAQPTKRVQFLIALRDPADHMWSAFHFFWIEGMDDKASQHYHDKYRTPALFHEMVAAGNWTTPGLEFLQKRRYETITTPRRLIQMVGKENVIFVKNEDMLPGVAEKEGGLLDQLSEKLQLDREGFNWTSVDTGPKCKNCTQNGVYHKTSHGRYMYPETREILYLQFLEECKVWAEEFGVEYPDCLNVLDRHRRRLGEPSKVS